MKKLLIILLFFFVLVGMFVTGYYFKYRIMKLEIEEEKVIVNNITIYGTHLNMDMSFNFDSDFELVLYDGNFRNISILKINDKYVLSEYNNEGLYLDNLDNGKYYMFYRCKFVDEGNKEKYKYYALSNTTNYNETIYYTFSNYNKKISITSDNQYSTLMITVENNKNNEVYDIVLDPGHGGRDGGASHYGYSETDFTFKIANGVKKILEENGLKVKLSYEENQLSKDEKLNEYGLHGRATIPYEVHAKYLFSFHLNSNSDRSVNGLEIYTANNNNYNFAMNLANSIVLDTGLNYSNNKINKLFDGVYARTFTEEEIEESIKEKIDDNLNPYNITTSTNYYYIIRETGGIITGAYVDDRNSLVDGNPYYNSNVGVEAYLLELGFLSNKNDLNNVINNMDKYINSIAKNILSLYDKKELEN